MSEERRKSEQAGSEEEERRGQEGTGDILRNSPPSSE